MPTTFLPVWNMLMRRLQLKAWETVLVLSASAGVGTAAIQVAKNIIGARVIATTSTPEKAAKALQLGADEVINYNEEDIAERARALTGGVGVDAVVDHVGADFFSPAFNALRPGGRFGTCGATTGLRTELHLGLLFSQQKRFTASSWETRKICGRSSLFSTAAPSGRWSTVSSPCMTRPPPPDHGGDQFLWKAGADTLGDGSNPPFPRKDGPALRFRGLSLEPPAVKQILLGVSAVAAEVVLRPLQHHTVGRRFLTGKVPFSKRPPHPNVDGKCL